MVCANGKQNSHWGRCLHVPFEQQSQLTERALDEFNIFKMAAEIVILNEIIDASTDKELLLDYEEDGEFHLLSK